MNKLSKLKKMILRSNGEGAGGLDVLNVEREKKIEWKKNNEK